jgi:hypothetical protein
MASAQVWHRRFRGLEGGVVTTLSTQRSWWKLLTCHQHRLACDHTRTAAVWQGAGAVGLQCVCMAGVCLIDLRSGWQGQKRPPGLAASARPEKDMTTKPDEAAAAAAAAAAAGGQLGQM